MKKTSLNLDERLVRAARREADKTGKSLSETISGWARIGWETVRRQNTVTRRTSFRVVDLGGPSRIDLHCRRDWLDMLDK